MRAATALLIFSLLWASGGAQAHDTDAWPPGNHSSHVADFFWEPRAPPRETELRTHLTLAPETEVEDVALRICRVENYACRAPIEMTRHEDTDRFPRYSATIPWDGRFYAGVTEVGIAVILRLANGTTEESPATPWPGPVELPAGAGVYYFYDLPPPPPNLPAPTSILALAILFIVAIVRRL